MLPNYIDTIKSLIFSLANRLHCNIKMKKEYAHKMSKLIQMNFVELVPESKLMGIEERVWYTLHHCVYNPQKPGKIHIVFDCAASFNGMNINEA